MCCRKIQVGPSPRGATSRSYTARLAGHVPHTTKKAPELGLEGFIRRRVIPRMNGDAIVHELLAHEAQCTPSRLFTIAKLFLLQLQDRDEHSRVHGT